MRVDPAAWLVRHRGWAVATWVGVGLALAPRAAHVERLLAVAPPAGPSEAALVDATLATRFETPFVNYALLLVGGAVRGAATAAATAAPRMRSDETKTVLVWLGQYPVDRSSWTFA